METLVGPSLGVLGGSHVDDMIGRMSQGPDFATLWDWDRKALRIYSAGLALKQAATAYQAVIDRAWQEAYKRFTTEFSKPAEDEKKPHQQLARRDRALVFDRQPDAARGASLERVPGSTAQPAACGDGLPPATASRRRGVLRDVPDTGTHRSGRDCPHGSRAAARGAWVEAHARRACIRERPKSLRAAAHELRRQGASRRALKTKPNRRRNSHGPLHSVFAC